MRTLLAASLVALALPGAASAATTIVVNPGDNPDAKVDSAAAGDTVLFKAGSHSGSISSATANLTIKGEPGAVLSSPTDATGATPTISFTAASGGADVVDGLTVINQVTTGPAIAGGSAGLTVKDLTALSGKGDAIAFGGGTNALLRSTVASLLATGTAVTANSATGTPALTLNVDSSVLVGKQSLGSTYATPTALGAGVTVAARHVTAIGAVVADSSGAPTLGASPIAITFTDSIIRGARTATTGTGTVGATITTTTRNDVKDTAADAASLFVRPAGFNYHLRADASSVIDKGSITSGESETDVDGNPRTSGAASDLGADEFVNRVPTASLAAPSGAVRQGIPATFNASKSSDPEALVGGGIAKYHWDFGDGSATDTTTATTTHAFAERKAYSVTVTVTDKQGAASSASAPVTFTVIDGTPPAVTISQPGAKQRLNLYKTKKGKKTKKRAKVTFFGDASDDTGLTGVYLALRPVASSNGSCKWFNGKTKLTSAACTAPVLLTAKLSGTTWRYTLPLKAKLASGPYLLTVVAVDASGLASPVKTSTFRFR
ncbi:MAG: PKD domain-containing protein [Solirubrobacteraceae bacterium]